MVLYVGEIYKSKRTSAISVGLLYSFMPGSTYFAALDSEVANEHIPWWQAPRNLQEGSMWILDFIDDPITKEKEVKSYKPFTEVLDLKKYKRINPFDIIKELRSLNLPFIPSPRAYLCLEEDVWCGPVSLTRDTKHKSQWVFDWQLSDSYIPIVNLVHENFVHLPLHPERTFVSPWYEPGPPFSFIDMRTFELVSADNMQLEILMNLKTTETRRDIAIENTSQLMALPVKQTKVQQPAAKFKSVVTNFIEDIPKSNEDLAEDKKYYRNNKKLEKISK
ncbi:hypothetical protein [Dictyobacter kobayashii]|uniref:Uncharacterized protein n=1 Tax=Dictyobacter kobayashii TaxID=2014872 RepID=A0A402AVP2_9CHLR|nr:hypothetical protein [Dictyobacter kobayashii]GCE23210.1 hypothetical protein KDK_70100 [Dictyobacter kobayashii]